MDTKQWASIVRQLPCLVCGRPSDDPHHIRVNRLTGEHFGLGQKADDWSIIPLCWIHHLDPEVGYHGNPARFCELHGDELALLQKTYDIALALIRKGEI